MPWTARRQSSSARATWRDRAPRGGDGHGDDHRAQLLDAVGVAQAGEAGVEGEDVGGLVEAEVAAVESTHGAGVGEAQGDGAGDAQASRFEGGADGAGEEVGVGTIGVGEVDLDVDAVGDSAVWDGHGA